MNQVCHVKLSTNIMTRAAFNFHCIQMKNETSTNETLGFLMKKKKKTFISNWITHILFSSMKFVLIHNHLELVCRAFRANINKWMNWTSKAEKAHWTSKHRKFQRNKVVSFSKIFVLLKCIDNFSAIESKTKSNLPTKAITVSTTRTLTDNEKHRKRICSIQRKWEHSGWKIEWNLFAIQCTKLIVEMLLQIQWQIHESDFCQTHKCIV